MSLASSIVIRPAKVADLPAINEIFNYYVRTSTCIYQLTEEPLNARKLWLKNRSERHPVFVVECDGAVLGWGALSQYSSRGGWRFTAEDSIYLAPDACGQIIGVTLMNYLLDFARKNGFRAIIARISADQSASVALHAKVGFIEVGRLRNVGNKFNQWLDVVYMEKILD